MDTSDIKVLESFLEKQIEKKEKIDKSIAKYQAQIEYIKDANTKGYNILYGIAYAKEIPRDKKISLLLAFHYDDERKGRKNTGYYIRASWLEGNSKKRISLLPIKVADVSFVYLERGWYKHKLNEGKNDKIILSLCDYTNLGYPEFEQKMISKFMDKNFHKVLKQWNSAEYKNWDFIIDTDSYKFDELNSLLNFK